MQIAGIAIVALGIVGIIWGILQKMKAGRVADAPLASTGDVMQKGRAICGPKGQISAQGNVVCQQPVVAPFSGAQCLWYKLTCTAEWKDGDTNKSKVLDEQKVAAQFGIDDGSGPIWVDAREGGDFEPTQSKSDSKGTGIIGGITGTDLVFGNYRVQTGMLNMGTKYKVEEEILPLVPRLYACGKLADQGGLIGPPSWRQLILSAKSRDELLSAASKGAKIFLSAGAAAFVIGSGLAVAAQVLDKGDTEPPPVASVAAKNIAPAVTSAPPVVSAATTETAPPAAVIGKAAPKPAASASAKGAKPDAGAPKPAASTKPATK